MITATVDVEDNGLIDLYADRMQHPEEFVRDVTVETVTALEPLLIADFQVEPEPVEKPIQWITPRQRRYIMRRIRLGFIPAPYIRSHALSRGWRLRIETLRGVHVYLDNPVSYADYVEGIQQQKMHALTGWLYMPDKIEFWGAKLVDAVSQDLAYVWLSAFGKGPK